MNKETLVCRIIIFYILFFFTVELLITALFAFLGYWALITPEPPTGDKVHEVAIVFLVVFWLVQLYVLLIEFGFTKQKSSDSGAYSPKIP